jgi:hypothetical protein
MERNEFVRQYRAILKEALYFSEKGRREGLLQLEDLLDEDREKNRDIFMYGVRFMVDGTDGEVIDKILSNIVNQEKDEYIRLLKTIQKEAILSIQRGENTRILYSIMSSYTDIIYSDEEIDELTETISQSDISEKINEYLYDIAANNDYKDYKKFNIEVSPVLKDNIPRAYSIKITLYHLDDNSIYGSRSSVQCSIDCDGTSHWHTVQSHNDDLDSAGERVQNLMPFAKEIITKAVEMIKRESGKVLKGE